MPPSTSPANRAKEYAEMRTGGRRRRRACRKPKVLAGARLHAGSETLHPCSKPLPMQKTQASSWHQSTAELVPDASGEIYESMS